MQKVSGLDVDWMRTRGTYRWNVNWQEEHNEEGEKPNAEGESRDKDVLSSDVSVTVEKVKGQDKKNNGLYCQDNGSKR